MLTHRRLIRSFSEKTFYLRGSGERTPLPYQPSAFCSLSKLWVELYFGGYVEYVRFCLFLFMIYHMYWSLYMIIRYLMCRGYIYNRFQLTVVAVFSRSLRLGTPDYLGAIALWIRCYPCLAPPTNNKMFWAYYRLGEKRKSLSSRQVFFFLRI